MESMLRVLAQSGMTVAEVARVIGEHPQRAWNVLLHHVERAHGRMGLEKVWGVTVDEARRKRGHNSLTIVSEPKQDGQPTRVLLAVEGRGVGVRLPHGGATGEPCAGRGEAA